MTRDEKRKELAVGDTRTEAIFALGESRGITYNEEIHDLVEDMDTHLFQIFHKRRKSDRTCKRAITREARRPYSNGYGRDRRPVVVTLLPHELIETRLKGTRRRYAIAWDDLHAYLVRRAALAAMNARRKERADRRKARKNGGHR